MNTGRTWRNLHVICPGLRVRMERVYSKVIPALGLQNIRLLSRSMTVR